MRSTRTTFIIMLFVVLAASGAYVWWYSTVQAASSQASSLLTQISNETQTKDRVAQARQALADLESQEQAVNNYFVGQSDVVPFIEKLTGIGTSLGTTVAVSSVAANSDSDTPTLTMILTVTGSFDHVMRTVGAIENAPYDLTITSLTLNSTGKNSWNASLGIVVGSGSPPATTTPATSP